jgi:CDP-diacylglycerol--serine O-phosphatidyltransferase
LLNLSSGVYAILLANSHNYISLLPLASIMGVIAAVVDFFDGFAARLLNVKSNIGKQLDSLADMVSFGVAPAVIMVCLLNGASRVVPVFVQIVTFIVIILFPCFVALRLAKFNVDERQTTEFYGLPSPAAAFVLISLPFFPSFEYSLSIYTGIILLLGVLMLSNVRLFSLKFTNYKIKENIFRYFLLTFALFLLLFLKQRSLPFIIFAYIALSMVQNGLNKWCRKNSDNGD